MRVRSLVVCLIIGPGFVPWMADATLGVSPATTTSTVVRVAAKGSSAGKFPVTNRVSRVALPVARATPAPVAKAGAVRAPATPVPPPPVAKPLQARLQLHPATTGAVVRVVSARRGTPPAQVVVGKPSPSTPPPRPEPVVSSDFRFGPKGLTRQIDRNWSMSFSAALSPAPSASSKGESASPLERVMPVIKLEKTF